MIDHDHYPDAYLAQILRQTRTVAVVGASPDPYRASHQVMAFLKARGMTVYPVNPRAAGSLICGETCLPDLAAVPVPIDLVDIFRASEQVPPIVDQAIAVGARAIWMQLGVRHPDSAARAEAAGLSVVMNRCPIIEWPLVMGRDLSP